MSKYPLITKQRPSDMAAWQDCQWRREPCGKDECPICGSIKRDRAELAARGEDPDSMDSAFKMVGKTMTETLGLLYKQAEEMGIDLDNLDDMDIPEPPPPDSYPVYDKITDWRWGIYQLADECDEASSVWLSSEAGQDLLWYAHTLNAKVFRQLRTVWRMEREGEEFLDLEYGYTDFVLGEVLSILDKALFELATNGGILADKFKIAQLEYEFIKGEIKKL